jgi:hypothetical protein
LPACIDDRRAVQIGAREAAVAEMRKSFMPQIGHHTEIGVSGNEPGVRVSGGEFQTLRQIARTRESPAGKLVIEREKRRDRQSKSPPHRCIARRLKRPHGVADRPATIPHSRALLLREHTHAETRRAISTLRTAALGHGALSIGQLARLRAHLRQSLDRVDFTSGCSGKRDEATVYRLTRRAIHAGVNEQNRARPAFPLGATFLRARKTTSPYGHRFTVRNELQTRARGRHDEFYCARGLL